MTSPDRLDELYELASAYLDGETTAEETARVEADTEILDLVAELRPTQALWAEPVTPPPAAAREQAIAAALDAFDRDPSRDTAAGTGLDAATPRPVSEAPVTPPTRREWTPAKPSLAERLGKPLAIAAGFVLTVSGIGWILTQGGGFQNETAETMSAESSSDVVDTAADAANTATDSITSDRAASESAVDAAGDAAGDVADAVADSAGSDDDAAEAAEVEEAMVDDAAMEDAVTESAAAVAEAPEPAAEPAAEAELTEELTVEEAGVEEAGADFGNLVGDDSLAVAPEDDDARSIDVPQLGTFGSIDELLDSLSQGEAGGLLALRSGLAPILVSDVRFPCQDTLAELANPDDPAPLLRFYGDAIIAGEPNPVHVLRRSIDRADELRILRSGSCELVQAAPLGPS